MKEPLQFFLRGSVASWLANFLLSAHRMDGETLQASSLRAFSFQKFLNKTTFWQVFMNEGRRVLAGEAILSGLAIGERSRIGREEEMLDALVREHSRLVYRVAYAVLRRHHDAEDATQETFMRVLRYSSKLATVENPKTWLARIAWRVALDRCKQRGRVREISLEDPEKPVEVADSCTSADQALHGTQVSAPKSALYWNGSSQRFPRSCESR